MAVIYRSDLDSINNFAESLLSQEVQDSDTLINKINSFIAESGQELSGDVWNKVRTNLGNYIIALNQRKAVANALIESILAANRVMLSYLNEGTTEYFDYADDSELPNLYYLLNTAKATLSAYDSSSDDSDFKIDQSVIDEIYSNIIILNEKIEKLENLVPRDNNAYSNYGSAEAAISNLENTVSSINVSKVVNV